MTQAVFMVGLLCGLFVFGSIWDHFGRKFSLFVSLGFLVSTISFHIHSKIAPILSIGSLLHAVVPSMFSCFYPKGCKNYLNGKQYMYKIIL